MAAVDLVNLKTGNHVTLRQVYPELSYDDALEHLSSVVDDPQDLNIDREDFLMAVELAANTLLLKLLDNNHAAVGAYIDRADGNNFAAYTLAKLEIEDAQRVADEDGVNTSLSPLQAEFVTKFIEVTRASRSEAEEAGTKSGFRNIDAAIAAFFGDDAPAELLALVDFSSDDSSIPSTTYLPITNTDIDAGIDGSDMSLLADWLWTSAHEQSRQLDLARDMDTLETFMWVAAPDQETKHTREYLRESWEKYGDGTTAGTVATHIDRHDRHVYMDIFQVDETIAAEHLRMSDDLLTAFRLANPDRLPSKKASALIDRYHKMRRTWRLRLNRLMALRGEMRRRGLEIPKAAAPHTPYHLRVVARPSPTDSAKATKTADPVRNAHATDPAEDANAVASSSIANAPKHPVSLPSPLPTNAPAVSTPDITKAVENITIFDGDELEYWVVPGKVMK